MDSTRRWASLPLRAVLLLAGIIAAPALLAAETDITCNNPFGRRLALGLFQEYAVASAQSGFPDGVLVKAHTGNDLGSFGQASGPNAFGTEIARVDLNGDGQDELAVAGIKASDPHTISVTVFWSDLVGIQQAPSWEWTADAGATIQDLKIASADVTGRDTDSKQELIVAYRDSNNVVRVLVLNASGSNRTIQQASNTALGQWTMSAGDGPIANLRMATGDGLLEGRDQIVLMGTANNGANRVYFVLRYDDATVDHLSSKTFSEPRSPTGSPVGFDLRVADLGGTAAAEVLVHDQALDGDTVSSISQLVKYFTTTRVNNVVTDFVLNNGPTNTINSTRSKFAVAVGEVDRQPGAEIVVARQNNSDVNNHLLLEWYKVGFDVSGHPASIGPYLSPNAPHNPVYYEEYETYASISQLDVTIGAPNGNGIGQIAFAAKDQVSQNDSTPIVKIRSYGLPVPYPDPNANPNPDLLGIVGATTYPAAQSNVNALHITSLDFDGDSVLADYDGSCARVTEPMVRSVVHLPPYWTLLQAGSAGAVATIGESVNMTTGSGTTYSTSTSHDISGYLGLSIGGDVMGVGAEISAKATAGYTYETEHGETLDTTASLSVNQSQGVNGGEGLVVDEENTFDCYSYNVHAFGVTDPGSNVRSCELVRYISNTDQRSFKAWDLFSWDTQVAYPISGVVPAQWVPLAPDWASVALFHAPRANFVPAAGSLEAATDGSFASEIKSPAMTQPYIEIDLGSVKPLTDVRVFPAAGQIAQLQGFSLYVSAIPFSGDAPPTGADVAVFSTDPKSGNGFDHWIVPMRDPATQAPLAGRYVRLQAPGPAATTLWISEIEVFGDVHIEPPSYPQSVCDPIRGDGVFTVLMYDPNAGYRKVDVRGQLLWSGAPQDVDTCGTDFADTDAQHQDGVQHVLIWDQTTIGASASGSVSWDLSNNIDNTVGSNTSISHSTRVGAEIDVQAGAVVKANAGGAYEFATGVTVDTQTSMSWGTGLEYTGGMGGFQNPDNTHDWTKCEYRAQPFAYTTSERSNIGYEHQYTVVDYVVRDLTWIRGDPTNYPPTYCYAIPPDRLFSGTFD